MAKWVARLALEVAFEAKDANEAGEVAASALSAPESYGGFQITGRTCAWLAEAKEDSNQDTKPNK